MGLYLVVSSKCKDFASREVVTELGFSIRYQTCLGTDLCFQLPAHTTTLPRIFSGLSGSFTNCCRSIQPSCAAYTQSLVLGPPFSPPVYLPLGGATLKYHRMNEMYCLTVLEPEVQDQGAATIVSLEVSLLSLKVAIHT